MQQNSHRRFIGKEREGAGGGGRDQSLGTRVAVEKERERKRGRKRQEVGKVYLLKGNIPNVHRRCS